VHAKPLAQAIRAHIFIDECVSMDYCALFYSERWWKKILIALRRVCSVRGLVSPGGDFYVGPWDELADHPMQHMSLGCVHIQANVGLLELLPRI
jgi:hypothetical protein